MKAWVIYAFVSMGFAGVTAVIAKTGLAGISAELGLAVRNVFVFVFVGAISLSMVRWNEWTGLRGGNLWWLGVSALTTSLSWVFYYKALKDGEVSTVALIDKGSVIVAVIAAAVLFKEEITWSKVIGGCLIIGGVAIVARK